jgi:hypothetical protein
VEKVIKELLDRQATVDGYVPGDVLKLLGEDGLKLTTQLIKTHTHTHVCVKQESGPRISLKLR